MKTQLTLSPEPITEVPPTISDGMGAVVVFHGVVRGTEDGESIAAIHYEANEAMARHQFELIFTAIENQWPVESIRLVHRVGEVAVNEASLRVEVIAPHRAEAFAACQFLIDEMKAKVPIWKRAVALP
jgi:molybdopterin synthase catalytic subunit